MTPVNKLLNVVCVCEIRGRLRCSAASIGYRGWIRKGFVHSPVTPLSRNPCQAGNYHRRGIPADTKGGGESFVSARRFLDPRSGYISAPNARLSHLRRACLTCRRRSAAPRVAFDSSANRHRHAPFACRWPRQVFPCASAPGPGGVFRVFQKNRKIQERAGGLHGSTETRNDVSCRWPTGGLRRAPVA